MESRPTCSSSSGKAFAYRAAEEVADFAELAAEDALRKLAPGLDAKGVEKVSAAVWRAVIAAVENVEWTL